MENGGALQGELEQFAFVFREMKALYNKDKAAGAGAAVRRELGSVCSRILENTAVFKDKAVTVKFAEELGFKVL